MKAERLHELVRRALELPGEFTPAERTEIVIRDEFLDWVDAFAVFEAVKSGKVPGAFRVYLRGMCTAEIVVAAMSEDAAERVALNLSPDPDPGVSWEVERVEPYEP